VRGVNAHAMACGTDWGEFRQGSKKDENRNEVSGGEGEERKRTRRNLEFLEKE